MEIKTMEFRANLQFLKEKVCKIPIGTYSMYHADDGENNKLGVTVYILKITSFCKCRNSLSLMGNDKNFFSVRL